MTDLLCIAPHPDDAEFCCGGLLLLAKRAGWNLAIVDCTRGEMATRGSVATRRKEAAAADRLLRPEARINLKQPDGHLRDDDALREPLVRALRRFRPRIVLAPHWESQHPDHGAVGRAAAAAAWLCGAPKYDPRSAKGVASAARVPYRPELVLHYNNRHGIEADLVLDVSAVFKEKIRLLRCYDTQFGAGKAGRKTGRGKAPLTKLSSEQFIAFLRAMHAYYGAKIGVEYGEAYCVKGPVPVKTLAAFLPEGKKEA